MLCNDIDLSSPPLPPLPPTFFVMLLQRMVEAKKAVILYITPPFNLLSHHQIHQPVCRLPSSLELFELVRLYTVIYTT